MLTFIYPGFDCVSFALFPLKKKQLLVVKLIPFKTNPTAGVLTKSQSQLPRGTNQQSRFGLTRPASAASKATQGISRKPEVIRSCVYGRLVPRRHQQEGTLRMYLFPLFFGNHGLRRMIGTPSSPRAVGKHSEDHGWSRTIVLLRPSAEWTMDPPPSLLCRCPESTALPHW